MISDHAANATDHHSYLARIACSVETRHFSRPLEKIPARTKRLLPRHAHILGVAAAIFEDFFFPAWLPARRGRVGRPPARVVVARLCVGAVITRSVAPKSATRLRSIRTEREKKRAAALLLAPRAPAAPPRDECGTCGYTQPH
ncbi:hypothetical protein MTO96_007314 [Rhipicephalus appendiculatus]